MDSEVATGSLVVNILKMNMSSDTKITLKKSSSYNPAPSDSA